MGWSERHIPAMTTMIAELYEAVKAAGAPEDTAQAAAKALADRERRFDSIDGKLAALEAQVTMVKWITGATFAGVLALILRTFVGG
jgi:hypothetical protein